MFSPGLDGPEGALDTIKDQVCLALTLMDQRVPWTPSGPGLFSPGLDGPEGALDTIKDQVYLALTLMDQKGPWTPSRTRFV